MPLNCFYVTLHLEQRQSYWLVEIVLIYSLDLRYLPKSFALYSLEVTLSFLVKLGISQKGEIKDAFFASFGNWNSALLLFSKYLSCFSLKKNIIFLLTGLRIYTGEYKAQGPTLCPTEGRALRGPRALYSPV